MGKLSLVGAIVFIGIAVFLKQRGLPVFFYGLIFRRSFWLLARAIAVGAAAAAALFFAMRPLWNRRQSRLPPVLTLIVILLLFAKFLLAAFLICLGLVLYLILGVVLKSVGAVGGLFAS